MVSWAKICSSFSGLHTW